jgi:hypothetical protein
VLALPSQYAIPDVSGEFIMEVAQILANSVSPMTAEEVARSFSKNFSNYYVISALNVCSQLGLTTKTDSVYAAADEFQSDIKRATHEELFVPFQGRLRQYPPFLLYVDFASKGYDSKESAARARGILRITGSSETIESSLRRWGVYSRLVDYEKGTGKLHVRINFARFTAEYVAGLLRAFEADLKARIFLIDMLGPEVFAYLNGFGVHVDDLSSALLEYETDSKGAAAKATQTLELILWKIAENHKLSLAAKGMADVADALWKSKVILKNQHRVTRGLVGMRNMSHHDPDQETGKEWTITKEASLLTTLFVPVLVKSLYLYDQEKKQVL